MKYEISKIEAVRSFYAEKEITARFTYYTDGKKSPKDGATEFSVSVPADAPEYKEAIVIKSVRKVPTERKGQVTKATILRQYIDEQAVAGTFDMETAIKWTMEKFGFKRQLARAYLKDKVPA
jgi:hypothetical protein